jgi:hypothetical protein
MDPVTCSVTFRFDVLPGHTIGFFRLNAEEASATQMPATLSLAGPTGSFGLEAVGGLAMQGCWSARAGSGPEQIKTTMVAT